MTRTYNNIIKRRHTHEKSRSVIDIFSGKVELPRPMKVNPVLHHTKIIGDNNIKTFSIGGLGKLGKSIGQSITHVGDVLYGDIKDTPIAQQVDDNPDVVKGIGDVLGVVGAVTGQPEISVGGVILKTGADAAQEQTTAGKVGKMTQGAGKIGDSKTLQDIGKEIHKNRKIEEKIRDVLSKEVKTEDEEKHIMENISKFNKTQTEVLKKGIHLNQLHTSQERANQVLLDKDLQKLEKVEKEEVDALGRIVTTLDRPGSFEDMLKDLGGFETDKAKMDYVVENFGAFNRLSPQNRKQLLNSLLRHGNIIGVGF